MTTGDCSLKGKTVRSIIPNGFIVAFTGAVIAGVSFELLSSLESGGVCWFLSGVLSCTDPIAIVRIVFYLAVAGSSLVILGAFQMGLWRNLIVRESSVLVITIGSSTLFLGFFMASVFPSPSGVSAGIAMFFGLLGAALLMTGIVKIGVGEKGSAAMSAPILNNVLPREPRGLSTFLILTGLGVIACLASSWLITYEILTPGGGGVYWGFPFAWKSIQSWLGTYEGFQYDWFWFIADSMIYTAGGYFVLYFFWANSSTSKKEAINRFLESRRSIALLSITVIALFIGNWVYDYLYLWHLWR